MFRSPSRTSAKIGVAPAWTITFAVAGQGIGVGITSSPGPPPSASAERWSAAVPDATASACLAPAYSAKRSSSSAARGPVVSQPERSVSATAAISSSPIAGGWKPSIVFLRVSDESFDIGLESDCLFSPRSALERLLAALAHGQDRSGPVRSTAKLLETVARAAVDPNAADAFLSKGLLDARHLPQRTGRRDEKADAGATDTP